MKIPTGTHVIRHRTDELQEVFRPIASLVSKCEKALQKLVPGTWQHAMLRDNLKALHVASALIGKETDNADEFTRDDLQEALRMFASLIGKVEKAQARFALGTSQHTLQRNRLRALSKATALIKMELAAEVPLGPTGVAAKGRQRVQ
jgi:hypothetical protein